MNTGRGTAAGIQGSCAAIPCLSLPGRRHAVGHADTYHASDGRIFADGGVGSAGGGVPAGVAQDRVFVLAVRLHHLRWAMVRSNFVKAF